MLALARLVVSFVIPIKIFAFLVRTAMRSLGSRLAQFAEIFHFAGGEKSVCVVRLVFACRCRLLLRAARTTTPPAPPPASRRMSFATAFLGLIGFSLLTFVRDGLRAGLIVAIGGVASGFARGRFLAASGSPASATAASAAATLCSLFFRFAAGFNDFAGLDFKFINLESLDPIVGRTLDERKMIVRLLGSLLTRFRLFFVPRSWLLAAPAFFASAFFASAFFAPAFVASARVPFMAARTAVPRTVPAASSFRTLSPVRPLFAPLATFRGRRRTSRRFFRADMGRSRRWCRRLAHRRRKPLLWWNL